jgi:hypothetical protein
VLWANFNRFLKVIAAKIATCIILQMPVLEWCVQLVRLVINNSLPLVVSAASAEQESTGFFLTPASAAKLVAFEVALLMVFSLSVPSVRLVIINMLPGQHRASLAFRVVQIILRNKFSAHSVA